MMQVSPAHLQNGYVAVLYVIDFELNQVSRGQQLCRNGSSHIYTSQQEILIRISQADPRSDNYRAES